MPVSDRAIVRSRRLSGPVLLALGASVTVLVLLAVAATPALGYRAWNHATAVGKASCAVGCHTGAVPSNATCTRCHTGFTTAGAEKCWTCHEPGESTSAWQAAAGCTTTCHLWTESGEAPSYDTSFTHGSDVHLGASGYGRTCVECHGVSTGSAAPGASPHHDAVDDAAPTCAWCHDGVIASVPTGHSSFGTSCSSCHTGMDRPSADCAACHVGRTGTTTPQITYTNTLACGDVACHGKIASHSDTPIGAAPCTACHAAHFETLGACETCHPGPQTFHHGTAAARPLADCGGCHDGGIAATTTSHLTLPCWWCHADMGAAPMPEACLRCHHPERFGAAACTACHSVAGLTGREQVHSATPNAGITCTTCHTGHYADLGACASCHDLVPEAHHGVAALTSSVLTLRAAPVRLTAGASATVSGTLADEAGAARSGVEVLLQERRVARTAFSDLATVTTGADGSFRRAVRPVAGTQYRAVYRGSATSAAAALRPSLAEAQVKVAQSLRLRARPGAVRARARVRFTGKLAPTAQQLGGRRPAVTLRIERKRGSRWVRVLTVTVRPNTSGAFSKTWRPKKAGSYRATAIAAATAELLAAKARVAVRVR